MRHAVFGLLLGCLLGGVRILSAAEQPAYEIPEPPSAKTDHHPVPVVIPPAGDPLPPHATARLGSARFKVGSGGSLLAFTPDGKELVCTGYGNALNWFDAKTGQLRRQCTDTARFLRPDNIVVAPRAGWLAYPPADAKNRFIVCDLATAKPRAVVPAAPAAKLSEEDAALALLGADPKLVLSPDERWLAICDTELTEIFDTRTWKPVAALKVERAASPGAAFSADGQALVIARMKHFPDGGYSSVLSFYSTDGFKLLHESDQASHIDAGPWTTTKALLTLEGGTIVRQWNWQTGKESNNVQRDAGLFCDLAANPRWSDLVVGIRPKPREPIVGLMLLDAQKLEFHHALRFPDEKIVAFGCAPDQKHLAMATDKGRIGIFNCTDGKWQSVLAVDDTWFSRLVFSADGSQLAVQDSTDRLSVLTLSTSVGVIAAPVGARRGVTQLQFAPNGKELIAWEPNAEGNLVRWDPATGKELARLTVGGYNPIFAADGTLSAWFTATEKNQFELRRMDGTTLSLGKGGNPQGRLFAPPAFAVSDRWIVWWDADAKKLAVADATTGKVASTIANIDDLDGRPLLVPGAKPLVVASPGDVIHGWDPVTGVEQFTLAALKGARPVEVSANGRYLAVVRVAAGKAELAVWDLQARKIAMPWQQSGLFGFDRNICLFSADGAWLVYVLPKNSLASYNLIAGQPGARWQLADSLWSFAWVPQQAILCTGDLNGNVQLWDVASGVCRTTVPTDQAGWTAVACSPDGKRLTTSSMDSTILLWDLPALLAAPAHNPTAPALNPQQ